MTAQPTTEDISIAKIYRYKKNGWVFKYDPDIMYVTAEHPHGGRQSICELKNRLDDDAFGYTIAKCLNDACHDINPLNEPSIELPNKSENIKSHGVTIIDRILKIFIHWPQMWSECLAKFASCFKR